MDNHDRRVSYAMQRFGCGQDQRPHVESLVRQHYEAGREDEPLTPRQLRRVKHKRGRGHRPVPATPAAVNPLWDVLNGWYPAKRFREQVAASLTGKR